MPHARAHLTSRIALAAIALLVPVGLVACGDDDTATSTTTTEVTSAPKAADVWARPGTTGGNTAVYMTITGGGSADALVSAAVPATLADKVELHETVAADTSGSSTTAMGSGSSTTTTAMGTATTAMGSAGSTTTVAGGGMMTMRPVEKIAVPAKGSVTLKPGGLHVMLFGLKKDLVVGDEVAVTLTFDKAGEVTVTAKVREP